MKALIIACSIAAMAMLAPNAIKSADASQWQTRRYYHNNYVQPRHYNYGNQGYYYSPNRYYAPNRYNYNNGWNRGWNRTYYQGPGLYIGGPNVGFGIRF